MGAGRRAEAVVGGLLIGNPRAQGLVDGVLEGAGAGLDSVHLGAEDAHAHDVHGLALDVLGTHEDRALEPEAGRRGSRRHAVLAGACFGDEGGLAHLFGEQGLAEAVVHLVGAGMEQVLALEPEAEAELLREVGAEGQRGGTAGVVRQQLAQLVLEILRGQNVPHGGLHLDERGHEQLGHEAAAVFSKVAVFHRFVRGGLRGPRPPLCLFLGLLGPRAP